MIPSQVLCPQESLYNSLFLLFNLGGESRQITPGLTPAAPSVWDGEDGQVASYQNVYGNFIRVPTSPEAIRQRAMNARNAVRIRYNVR